VDYALELVRKFAMLFLKLLVPVLVVRVGVAERFDLFSLMFRHSRSERGLHVQAIHG
jgi:hypothetical protein